MRSERRVTIRSSRSRVHSAGALHRTRSLQRRKARSAGRSWAGRSRRGNARPRKAAHHSSPQSFADSAMLHAALARLARRHAHAPRHPAPGVAMAHESEVQRAHHLQHDHRKAQPGPERSVNRRETFHCDALGQLARRPAGRNSGSRQPRKTRRYGRSSQLKIVIVSGKFACNTLPWARRALSMAQRSGKAVASQVFCASMRVSSETR